MKEIIRITVRLTLSCLIAALVMGSVFTITDKAKKHNEHLTIQETVLSLLGYNKDNPAPSDLSLHRVYRYIIEDGGAKYLGYMVPVEKDGEEGYDLLVINLEGKFVDRFQLNVSPEIATEAPERKAALEAVLRPPRFFTYADSTIIAKLGEKRLAYLLPGEFPGFKTFIKVMLALDPDFKVIGLEIMEHEEDPGLGAEIEQEYFKNQFKEKGFDTIKGLKVIKEPLPDEYLRVLETKKRKKDLMTEREIEELRSKYQDRDIYAVTGATISSKAVAGGVQGMVTRFAYRLKILDQALTAQEVPSAF